MTDQKDSANEHPTGKKIFIQVGMSLEDAKRLQQAFDEGRLKDLGITEIKFSATEHAKPSEKRWTEDARRRRRNPKDDEAPPLP